MMYSELYKGLVPVAKGRPRFTRNGSVYTPVRTALYERRIRDGYHGSKFTGAIGMHVVFGMPIPKSAKKSEREQMIVGELFHTKRPDTDNLLKAVWDAGNGVMYEDDSQIVSVQAEKIYAVEPYVEIRIWEI